MDAADREEVTPLIYKYGIPTPVRDTRKPYQKQLAVYFILASTLFERIAFFSLTTNISLTLKSNVTTSDWDPRHSSTALLYIFSGTSYISTLIFAILSDAYVRRARTIIIGFVLYLVGYALITTTVLGKTFCNFPIDDANNITMEKCAPAILGTLICTAIGAGAVKSNLAVFGAEQSQESKRTSRYFDKYVVAVNIGNLIAILAIPYIQVELKRYFTAYIVAAAMPVMATLLFFTGWPYYIHVNSDETVVSNCIPVIINAFQSRSQYNKNQRSIEQQNTNPVSSTLLNASQSLTDQDKSIRIDERPSTFLDFAKAINHGKFHDRIVDDVKSLRGALVVFSLLIPYWLIYNQIDTTFSLQGQQMYNPSSKSYIVTWMSLGDPVIVIIGTLILNIFVYKYLDTRDRTVIITTKFVIGMCFAVIIMLIAGTVEIFRQEKCFGSSGHNLTIYWQIPQGIGIGFSQLFAMVASCEFAYFAAPRSAQSLFMSLHFCAIGISSFIGVAYMAVFSKILSTFDFICVGDGNSKWSFYTYFYILAGVQVIFIIIFIVCQRKFRIIKMNPQQI